MTRPTKPNHDHDPHDNHDNDNSRRQPENQAVAPAPAGGALASLAALAATLNRCDTAGVGGRSGLPMMQFKRDGNGTYMYGQRRTVPEPTSSWAANPYTFKYGVISFDNDNRPTERLVSISEPMPDLTQLPNTGFAWQPQWAVNLRCLDGADAGVEVEFKMSTTGGIQAIADLVEKVRDRVNSGQHDGKIVPIMLLEKDSYPHPEHGRVWIPILNVIDWMSLDGPPSKPAPKPEPAPAPVEQPRRRRVR